MIRHIVMWKFREGTEEKANEFLTKLAALDGVIPQLKKSEVARNIGKDNYDAVLLRPTHCSRSSAPARR